MIPLFYGFVKQAGLIFPIAGSISYDCTKA